MLALSDAVRDGVISNAEIVVVISDKADAAGLVHANERGIETLVVERRGRNREEHEKEIIAALRERGVDLICLAGYMRLLSPCFVEAFRGRILNIHPSLLPAFPGLDAQRQALDHGAKVSGCTVHFVDETLDGGPIIAQREVPVLEGDTVETLSARILEQEHKLYSDAVALVLEKYAKEHTESQIICVKSFGAFTSCLLSEATRPFETPPTPLSTTQSSNYLSPSDRSPLPRYLQVRSPCCATRRDACATLSQTKLRRASSGGPAPARRAARTPCELPHRSTLP